MEKIARVLCLLAFAVHSCSAIGVCLRRCGSETFNCQCGSQPGQTVNVQIEKCTFFYKWKPYCHASVDGERVKAEDICPKYLQCATCNQDGGSCSTCPPGKSGTFCNRDCWCKNGGQCVSSYCICPPGYQGASCEIKTDCGCLNGGQCSATWDSCICPSEFQGAFCQTKKGCPTLQTSPLLTVIKIPEETPQLMEFKCPPFGYLLEGSPRATCLTETNQWDHPAPSCVPACSVPEAPNGGVILNPPLDGSLVKSGQYLEFECEAGHAMLGFKMINCTGDGTWSHGAPVCIQVAFCHEPESLSYATYEEHTPPFQPPFSNGTRVVFSCLDGYLMFGQSQITCGDDGRWSKDRPTCVRVYDSEVDCMTTGSRVVEEIGKPVRIHCPPGCVNVNDSVWGTVIYEESSSVCRAAIHSGRISNLLGGSVFVVNNGVYNDFFPSTLHGVESERKNGISGSFRFHHDPDIDLQNQDNPDKGCPRGWTELQGHCIYVVTKRRVWGAARTICNNMGSRLPSLQDPAFIKEVLKMRGSDVDRLWLLSKSNTNTTSASLPLWIGQNLALNPEIAALETEDNDSENILESDQLSCSVVSRSSNSSVWKSQPCSETAPFICEIDMRQYQVKCEDRGQLENGLALLEDPDRGLRRGAVMKFQCNDLHVLSGESSSTCLPGGAWSSPMPICQRIPACLDPPNVEFGSINVQGPSAPSSTSRIGYGPRTRGSRIGISDFLRNTRSVQNDVNFVLPAGHHRVGSRAVYSCPPKYYKLIGSKTRRCKKDGTWSGTPVTCYSVCGQSDSPRSPFLYGGNSSDVGQWPWQVGLAHVHENSLLVCGGSLISEYWILTAAHCVVDELTLFPLEPEQIRLYAGKYYRDDLKNDDFVQTRRASEIRVHGKYDPSTYDSDIALVKMDSPVKLTSRVQPVCLPNDRSTRWNMADGRKGVATGWGLTEGQVYANTLRQAVLPVVSHEECEEGYKEAELPLTVTENMFCAGLAEGGADSCSGDSGGPMVFQVGTGENKRWVLEGIVSWGSLAGCGLRRQYGGFTKVNRFLDWIDHNI